MDNVLASKKGHELDILISELKKKNHSLIDFFSYLRQKWINENAKDYKVYIESIIGRPEERKFAAETSAYFEEIIRKRKYDWWSVEFHILMRLTEYSHLIDVIEEIDPEISNVIKKGYNLSILPLALVTRNKNLLNKFIPKKDFFTDHEAKSWDPYGIFSEEVKLNREGTYLASQKFKRSILMNITSLCPIGCTGCYKGEFTRISGKKFYTDFGNAVSIQSKLLVEHLNEHPEIKIVIISGGEPLLLSDDGFKAMLHQFSKARFLTEIRICTGVIFQGLPFRITDRLLDILENFENESGIKINFNAHLAHPEQFTPESLIAIKKITKRGFPINTQVPLQRNVNIFIDDFGKTMKTLCRLAQLQGSSGVRPYKYILHMNVGSLEYSVPLEFMLEVLAELKYRIDHPWPETWQPVSYSILYRKGNILLSPQMLYVIKKDVHPDKGFVKYHIPVPVGGGKWAIVDYSEPLLKGFNDNPESLNKYRF